MREPARATAAVAHCHLAHNSAAVAAEMLAVAFGSVAADSHGC